MDVDNVCILIPTLDEAGAIEEVITGFQSHGFTNIFVMDGGSTDGTQEIASEAGARVRVQSGSGKGQAVREAVQEIDVDYILMVDGDGTYHPSDAGRMLNPIMEGDADHVIGTRFPLEGEHSMSRFNQLGNKAINRLFSAVHGHDYTDILSGYRAFTRESLERLRLRSDGFTIETELAVEYARRPLETEVVPIEYAPRAGGTETNLNPVRDGGDIIAALFRLARFSNPMMYFGVPGVTSIFFGLFVAGYVALEWVVEGVGHEVIALVSAFSILIGVQLLLFAALSDLVVDLHNEQQNLLSEIRSE